MTITLYGITNCDQVKKARAWLDANQVAYVFHDVRKSGITEELIARWTRHVSWETLVNRKGTTWRMLDGDRKAAITDLRSATCLMLESATIIKRPVLDTGMATHVGFSIDLYQQIFKK